MRENNSRFYFVRDVMEMMEVKETKAYEIIKGFNKELKSMGKYTTPGRVHKSYFHFRVDFDIDEIRQKGISVKTV